MMLAGIEAEKPGLEKHTSKCRLPSRAKPDLISLRFLRWPPDWREDSAGPPTDRCSIRQSILRSIRRYHDLNRMRELPGMARAMVETLNAAWSADLDFQALAGMSVRLGDIALLERRVREALPAGALIPPVLRAAALARCSLAKRRFGRIKLDGIVDVELVWRPLLPTSRGQGRFGAFLIGVLGQRVCSENLWVAP